MPAPIAIFAFNRPKSLTAMIDSLKKNELYDASEKYIFIDGPRNDHDREKIKKVIQIAREVTQNIRISERNKGLGASIISGVTEVINLYGSAIVLEDDLRLMPGFLSYMNEALEKYRDHSDIFSICGYGLKIKRPKNYVGDVYLSDRSSSWGWATWADRWNSVDWEVKDFAELKANASARRAFNRAGSDMYGMLRDYMEGKNHSWAIRFCYSQFRQKRFSVHPFSSFVENDGFGEGATNCKQRYSRFETTPNHSLQVHLPPQLERKDDILRQLHRYHSILIRIYSKIRGILNV